MARLVRLESDGPLRIDPQDKPVFVCRCGLSQNYPMCDGAHKKCAWEEKGTLYIYSEDRSAVVETCEDPGADHPRA